MPYAEGDVDILGRFASFRGQLRKIGWIENRNLEIEERWSGDDMRRIKHDAARLPEGGEP
jgi:hypothetical protein